MGRFSGRCAEHPRRLFTHFSTKQNTPKTLAIAGENGLADTAILVRKLATCGGKIGRDCPSYFLAGISAGVAKPPLRRSQRTATPTAQGHFQPQCQGVANRLFLRPRSCGYGKCKRGVALFGRCTRKCGRKEKSMAEPKDKNKFALWTYPETIKRVDKLYPPSPVS